MNMIKLLK